MRPIDADALHINITCGRMNGKMEFADAVKAMINDAPTVDAVPVIRCKDCKHWQLEHYVGGQGMSCQMDNSDDVCLTEPTHFCAWAERKEE